MLGVLQPMQVVNGSELDHDSSADLRAGRVLQQLENDAVQLFGLVAVDRVVADIAFLGARPSSCLLVLERQLLVRQGQVEDDGGRVDYI